MRQISLASISLLVFLAACDTAGNVDPVFQTYFVKYYGEDGNQEGVDMLVNPDGSMILLANSTPSENYTTAYIVKVDPAGNVMWQRELGEGNERAVDVEPDSQGNLIIVSNIGINNESRVRIFKIGQDGRGIDSLIVPSNEKQVAKSVMHTSNNNYLIAGYSAADPTRNPRLLIPPPDDADIIVLQIDPLLDVSRILLRQGGEHVGSAVKTFETIINDSTKYVVCGDSDRPVDAITYKRALEVISINTSGVQGLRRVSGPLNEIQIAATAIETPGSVGEGYLMVGTSYAGAQSKLYLTQYNKTFETKRIDKTLLDNIRLEGVSAAASDPGYFYILANEVLDNTNRNIYLVKLEGDGSVIGGTSFGTLEGDDTAGAVQVLPDGRIAVLGTMELETQKKMVLITLSQDGKFSD